MTMYYTAGSDDKHQITYSRWSCVHTLPELLFPVVSGHLDLESGVVANEAGETGEGLSPTATDADE